MFPFKTVHIQCSYILIPYNDKRMNSVINWYHTKSDCDPHAWRCNKMQSFILWQMKYIMLNLLWVAYPVKVLLKQIPNDIYINLCFVLCNICIRNYSDLLNYFHTHKKRRKELKEKGMCLSQSLIFNKLSIRVKLFFSLL